MLAVTGITGHTGRHFMEVLQKNHYDGTLRCLVRSEEKAQRLQQSGLQMQCVQGNLDCEEDIVRLLDGADTVLHIANIHYSPAIVRIGRACGVKRFVLIHTTGIYSRYKEAAEGYQRIEEEILPQMAEANITILRPTMIFGDLCDYNMSKFIRLVDRLPVVPAIDGGRSKIQPVNARDLAQACYDVLEAPQCAGKAYDLSGERPVTIAELYQMIAQGLGKKRITLGIPMGLGVCAARCLKALTLNRMDLEEKVRRMGEDRSYAHDAAAVDFGYNPEPFEIGLKREIEAYRAQRG